MLSILIPTYNYDITQLVNDLHRQAVECGIAFEIIVVEDGSKKFLEKNREIEQLHNCQYIVLSKNIGRSGVRNHLASLAVYDNLLFMDCDAEVCLYGYIKNFIPYFGQKKVVVGGRAYDSSNHDAQFSLRIKYDRVREARPAAMKQSDDNCTTFTTFNFLIPKTIFETVQFNEDLEGYGYEDTLFGNDLKELGIVILYIDNPLIHKGLDDNITYLRKTREGVKNLYFLYKTGHYPFLAKESKLLSTFVKIEKGKGIGIVALCFRVLKKTIEKNLCSVNPSLKLYDFYKLGAMCNIKNQQLTK